MKCYYYTENEQTNRFLVGAWDFERERLDILPEETISIMAREFSHKECASALNDDGYAIKLPMCRLYDVYLAFKFSVDREMREKAGQRMRVVFCCTENYRSTSSLYEDVRDIIRGLKAFCDQVGCQYDPCRLDSLQKAVYKKFGNLIDSIVRSVVSLPKRFCDRVG